MPLAVVSSDEFANHLTPPGHPERPERAHVFDAVATAWRRIHDRFIEIVRSTSSETLAIRANASTSVSASLGLLSTAAAIILAGWS